ncbi:hypothetical protein OIU85_012805 [Salix viminalis]|uniref:Uncharacterized protein n=1 Tax=Salix viminalis TaxID=40686 RepID=A0A9Q0SDL3_SALVM|nr:hypothetical protein OIU85_012805 [Salix viminalis]
MDVNEHLLTACVDDVEEIEFFDSLLEITDCMSTDDDFYEEKSEDKMICANEKKCETVENCAAQLSCANEEICAYEGDCAAQMSCTDEMEFHDQLDAVEISTELHEEMKNTEVIDLDTDRWGDINEEESTDEVDIPEHTNPRADTTGVLDHSAHAAADAELNEAANAEFNAHAAADAELNEAVNAEFNVAENLPYAEGGSSVAQGNQSHEAEGSR